HWTRDDAFLSPADRSPRPRRWHPDRALWPLGASLPRRGRGQHVRHAIRTPVERQLRRRHRALDRPRRDLRVRVVYGAAQLAFRQTLLVAVLCSCRCNPEYHRAREFVALPTADYRRRLVLPRLGPSLRLRVRG